MAIRGSASTNHILQHKSLCNFFCWHKPLAGSSGMRQATSPLDNAARAYLNSHQKKLQQRDTFHSAKAQFLKIGPNNVLPSWSRHSLLMKSGPLFSYFSLNNLLTIAIFLLKIANWQLSKLFNNILVIRFFYRPGERICPERM